MKIRIYFLIILNLICVYSQTDINTDVSCGTTTCNTALGECVGDPPSYCLCKEQYDTYPQESLVSCNYEKKKQLIAFILESFCGFGIGHFYTGNIGIAVFKLVVYLLGVCGILILRIVNMKTEDNNPTTLLLALMSCIVCCFILIWHVTDAFLYALGRYKDGNGIDLLRW